MAVGGDIYRIVIEIVSHVFDVPESDLTRDTHFVCDLDESLQVAETVMACEEEFGLEIPDRDAEKLETVGLLADYIEHRLQPGVGVWPPAPQWRRKTTPATHQ